MRFIFAHGFYTLSAVAEVFYKVTAEYSQEHERGIIGNEPHIRIAWPKGEKILSEKDKKVKDSLSLIYSK